jgi:arylformamidase
MDLSHNWRDITRPMSQKLATWPGDVPFEFQLGWAIAHGATVNVGAIRTSVHSGTHCDAPFHFASDGPTVETLDVSVWLGAATVIDVRDGDWDAALQPAQLRRAPRVLIRTDAWRDSGQFPTQIPALPPELVPCLATAGVVLYGIDLPSVDPLDSKTLAVHHALRAANIQILEGLDLHDIPEGAYELIALPLKLVGADGSPVRAVLRAMDAVATTPPPEGA